jgi:uncharacterized protein YjbJ (UPF0337 family)
VAQLEEFQPAGDHENPGGGVRPLVQNPTGISITNDKSNDFQRLACQVVSRLHRFARETTMRNSDRQQAEGTFHQKRGESRQKLGEAKNDPKLESKGRTEKIAGTVQKTLGKMERLAGK